MLLFFSLYSDYDKHSKWNVLECFVVLNMVVKPKIHCHGNQSFKNSDFDVLQY